MVERDARKQFSGVASMTKRRLVAASGATLGAALLAVVFQVLRHEPPPAIETPEVQATWIARIASETGVHLPPNARIVSASDGEPRDGTTFYFEWVVFSATPIQYPPAGARWDSLEVPVLAQSVRMIEAGITPYRISKPGEARDLDWMHGNVWCSATEVYGKRGIYVLLETRRQD
jgi:hypothetical protein